MVAIGIDLGTTYSCVGWWKDNRCEIIANDQGNRTTPSYVAFTDNERLIGDSAKNQISMKTISSVVEQYIKSKPFLLNSLSQGIINLTSLSRVMMPYLEKELGKDVKQGAIVMSLKRLSEELDFKINHKISRVLKNTGEITVRSSLTDYAFTISETLLDNQAKLLSEINKESDVFYTSSRGVNESNIIISTSAAYLVADLLKTEKITHKIENLSSITVKLPQENVSVPGVYYYIFQRLAWEGIIIHEVISTTNEFTIIVSDNQIDIAFKAIKDLKSIQD